MEDSNRHSPSCFACSAVALFTESQLFMLRLEIALPTLGTESVDRAAVINNSLRS
jgi:hypothetical protein